MSETTKSPLRKWLNTYILRASGFGAGGMALLVVILGLKAVLIDNPQIPDLATIERFGIVLLAAMLLGAVLGPIGGLFVRMEELPTKPD